MSICVYNPLPPRVWSRRESNGLCGVSSKSVVLEYKKNSLMQSSAMLYARNVRGYNDVKKSWAVQTQVFTDPNVGAVGRVGYRVVPGGGPCGTFIDGGTLICGSKTTSPCNPSPSINYTQKDPFKCFPSSASNVPGQLPLCTHYNQPQYIYKTHPSTNSQSKWPTNYKHLVKAIHYTL